MSRSHVRPSRFFNHFHTSARALERRFHDEARQLAFRGRTQAHARRWQAAARRRFAQVLGLDRLRLCPARPRKIGEQRLAGLRREEWLIQTEREVWMPYYLFVPEPPARAPLPLVLCPHGHGSGGKWATGGRTDIPELRAAIAKYNYDYGVAIARAGFITACPDARGFGQRREPAVQGDRREPLLLVRSSCHQLMLAAAPLGLCVQGLWTWDLMRLLDHLAQDPRVDAARVGCAGLSGGGMQTLDLAALDTRVRAAVVSGYFYGVREALQVGNSNCDCNLVPGLWEYFDMGDLGALAAPRGLFIETGAADRLNGASGVRNVRGQVRIARRVFRAWGATDRLAHHVFPGGHRWDGSRAIPWLRKMLAR